MSCHLVILYIGVEITVMGSVLFGMIIVPANWCVSSVGGITIVGEVVIFCASLVQKIKTLKQQLQSAQEELTRLKAVLKDLEERHGYDTVH